VSVIVGRSREGFCCIAPFASAWVTEAVHPPTTLQGGSMTRSARQLPYTFKRLADAAADTMEARDEAIGLRGEGNRRSSPSPVARHVDSFDFCTWSRQAFGPRGWLMGRSDAMHNQIRERARDGLSAFGKQS